MCTFLDHPLSEVCLSLLTYQGERLQCITIYSATTERETVGSLYLNLARWFLWLFSVSFGVLSLWLISFLI